MSVKSKNRIDLTCWARRQFALWNICDSLEVVVTRFAEVRGAETEEHRCGAAVSALVLEKVGAVLRAHLSPCHVAAAAAHQFGRIEGFATLLRVASRLTAVVGLLTLVTYVVSVTIHCVRR